MGTAAPLLVEAAAPVDEDDSEVLDDSEEDLVLVAVAVEVLFTALLERTEVEKEAPGVEPWAPVEEEPPVGMTGTEVERPVVEGAEVGCSVPEADAVLVGRSVATPVEDWMAVPVADWTLDSVPDWAAARAERARTRTEARML